MSQTESDMEDEHTDLNNRNTQESSNLEEFRAANDRNAEITDENIDRTDAIRAPARNATIDYRNPMPGSSQSFRNPMPGTSQSFRNPMPGTNQSFGNPMPGTSHSFGNPMPGTSQSFGNPMPGTSQSFRNPMPGTSQSFGNPMPGTSQSFGNPMPGTSQSFRNPIPGTSQSFGNPMPGTSQSFRNPMPGTSQSFRNPMPGTSQSFGNPMPGTSQMLDGCGDVVNEKKKTKGSKTKKTKQKKRKKVKVPKETKESDIKAQVPHNGDEDKDTEVKPNRARRLEPLDLPKQPTKFDIPRSAPEPQYGGCFGFIRTWLAKRKEKRREKKRQAIRARFSNSLKAKLAEHSHRKARGGVAFVIEISNRPTSLSKPVLPPIKRHAGPIKPGVDEKLLKAEIKRQEELNKRTRFVQIQEERRFENIERKFDNERGFQQKAALTIIAKQGQAKRNVSRMETERRCASVMRRAASRAASRATSRMARVPSDDSFDDHYLE